VAAIVHVDRGSVQPDRIDWLADRIDWLADRIDWLADRIDWLADRIDWLGNFARFRKWSNAWKPKTVRPSVRSSTDSSGFAVSCPAMPAGGLNTPNAMGTPANTLVGIEGREITTQERPNASATKWPRSKRPSPNIKRPVETHRRNCCERKSGSRIVLASYVRALASYVRAATGIRVTAVRGGRVGAVAPPDRKTIEEAFEIFAQIAPEQAQEAREHWKNNPDAIPYPMFSEMRKLHHLREHDPEAFERAVAGRKLESEARHMAERARHVKGEERERLANELRGHLNELFEIRMRNRDAKISRMQSELEKLRHDQEQRREQRDELIQRRFEEMLGEALF
jgi:hypothetical protein